MNRLTGILPHAVITVYISVLTSTGPHVSFGRTWSLPVFFVLAIVAYLETRKGSLSPVLKGYLLYLGVNVVGFRVLPNLSSYLLQSVPTAFLYGSLLVVALIPSLFGGPYFTEYFARKTVPSALWETDIFRTINRLMSWMWCGLFAACLVIALIPELFALRRDLLTTLVFQVAAPAGLLLGAGVPLNKCYPGYYQRRLGIAPVHGSARGADGPGVAQSSKAEKEEIMSNTLRVVAINGSPHKGGGNTSAMTQMLAPILALEGIDLEEIFLAERRIEYCVGCAVCLEKGKCWRQDDHAEILEKVLAADGVILASPVYFRHVTAQMKTFIDRSMAYGHKPRGSWKPGLAISVSAGMGETTTANYLAGVLHVYGAFSVGTFTALAVSPGGFLGEELVEARAADLARDLARAIKEKRRHPATERDLHYYLFMGDLVRREKNFMGDDYRHWQNSGLYEGFEAYVGQTFTKPPYDEEMRKTWIRDMVSNEVKRTKGAAANTTDEGNRAGPTFTSCRDLIRAMPLAFKKEAAGDLKAVFQFEIYGTENFTAYLTISAGTCTYNGGSHPAPDVVIKSPSDLWLAISKGEVSGQAAFMSGKYTVEGNLNLLMKLGSLFGK